MQVESSEDILGSKRLNYEFLLLVRDKKYPEALKMGKKILQQNPSNPSVQKFCFFIQQNNKQLVEMVEIEKEEQQYSSVDSNQDGEEQDNSEDQDKSSQDQEDQEQQEQQPIKEKKPVQLTTCTLNQIPHVCPRNHKKAIQQLQKQKKTNNTVITEENIAQQQAI